MTAGTPSRARRDGAGNIGAGPGSNATREIAIDATPPTVSCAVDPGTLWSPDNKLRPVTASVSVVDALSGPGQPTLVSVTSNEPGGDEDIAGFEVGTADLTGLLRAQRLGTGTGRVYALTYAGSDAAGNTAACSAQVTVAHDQGH